MFGHWGLYQWLFYAAAAAPPPRRAATGPPPRRAQSEENTSFVEEIHNFVENALTNQKKALPLSHLPRERRRYFWGVVPQPMAQWVSAERLFAHGVVECCISFSTTLFNYRFSAAANQPKAPRANNPLFMYFQYQKERFCVNCDWLQYSVHLQEPEPEILCPDGYRIELCQGNNIFEHRALVFDGRGAKYLTLLWKPFSKVLPSNLMTVQVANEYLYLDGGAGVIWSFQDLQKIVDCTFNAIGRIDICIDFEGSENRTQFINHLNSGHYYAQHKSEGSSWWHEVGAGNASKKQLHCLTWGSQKSEIKVKLYHKSREQGIINSDDAEKPWIVQQWKLNGMDIHNVWRLEFSLSGAGQLRWKGQPLTLDNVADEEWLLNVFCELYDSRFVTRINQGRRNGHHNNDERVFLFPLPKRAAGLKWADPKGQDYELPAAIVLLRSMMRQIDNPAIMAARPTFNDYATTILNLIDNYHLDGYFVRTYEQEAQDYFDELWTNVGQGIRHTTPSPARLQD